MKYQIAYEEKEMRGSMIIEKSVDMKKGNRGNYFVLMLSFIGWAIVACIPAIISTLLQISLVYDIITGKNITASSDIRMVVTYICLFVTIIAMNVIKVYMDASKVCFYDEIKK